MQVYDGATWTLQASNNPAWAYVDVLAGRGNDPGLTVPLSEIDADAMKTWADNCAAAGREFNYENRDEIAVRDLLAMIATAGRATPARNPWDGKYSVVEDKPQTICRQHFSPRNSWEMQSQRVFVELPHAIKAEFLDETQDWKQETQIVYRQGYSASNATIFESKTWEGITHPDQVRKETEFHLDSLEARPEIFSLKTDIENLVCQRGDWVRVSMPGALIGGSYGRINAVALSGTEVVSVDLDADCTMNVGKLYGVQIRDSTNTALDHAVDTVAGVQRTLTFSTPIPDTENQPAVGDLVLFGEQNLISVDCIVKTIRRFDGLHAELELVHRADHIHAGRTGPPPIWLSHITLPTNPLQAPLPAPIIEHIDSSDFFLARGPEGSLQARMSVQVRIPSGVNGLVSYFQAQYRLQDPVLGVGPWSISPLVSANKG